MTIHTFFILFCSLATSFVHAQVFQPVGRVGTSDSSLALAISEDGSTVVGRSTDFRAAWRWTPSAGLATFGSLPSGFFYGSADDVSADGTAVVGLISNGTESNVFRWDASNGTSIVPRLQATGFADPRISSNGLVIAGSTRGEFGASIPAIWNAATGVTPIPALSGLPAGRTGSAITASALSADGSIVAGTARIDLIFPATTNIPYRWATVSPSAQVILNNAQLFPPDSGANPQDLSADGSVMVGNVASLGFFRWTQTTGYVFFGFTLTDREARVSANGTTFITGSRYWSATTGIQPLTTVLTSAGCNFSGWSSLVATDLSANGQTLCGYGTNPQGQTEGWYATIPSPVSALPLLALACMPRRRTTRKTPYTAPQRT